MQIENFNFGTFEGHNAKTLASAEIFSEWTHSEYPTVSYDCLIEMAEETYPEKNQLVTLKKPDGRSTIVTQSPIMIKHFVFRSWEEYQRGRGSLKLTSNNEPNIWGNNREAWLRGKYLNTFDPSAEFTVRMAAKVKARFAKRTLPDYPNKIEL